MTTESPRTFTGMIAKVYNTMLFKTISKLKSRKLFGNIRTIIGEINPKLYIFHRPIKTLNYNKSGGNAFVCGFPQSIYFHTQRKDGANIATSISSHKKYFSYIDKNTEAIVHSPNGETDTSILSVKFCTIFDQIGQDNVIQTWMNLIKRK